MNKPEHHLPEPLSVTQQAAMEISQRRQSAVYKGMLFSLPGLLICIAVLYVALRGEIARDALLIWLSGLVATVLIRLAVVAAWHRRTPGVDSAPVWGRAGMALPLLTASWLGIGGALVFPVDSIVHQVFLAFILGGVTAGAIASLSHHRVVVASYILLTLTPLMVRFFMAPTATQHLMGGMLVVYALLLLAAAAHVHQTFSQNLKLAREADANERILRKQQLLLENAGHMALLGAWSFNSATSEFTFSREAAAIVGLPAGTVVAESVHAVLRAADAEQADEIMQALSQRQPLDARCRIRPPGGRIAWVRILGAGSSEEEQVIVGAIQDVTEATVDHELEAVRARLFEKMATDSSITELLEEGMQVVESVNPDLYCTIMLLNGEDKRLYSCAAPRLPAYVTGAMDGMAADKGRGSFAAALAGQRCIVSDIDTHPDWKAFHDVLRRAEMRACWLEPVKGADGRTLGVLAVYFRQIPMPSNLEITLIGKLAGMASIVVDRWQVSSRVRYGETRMQSIVDLAPSGFALLDNKLNILEANPALSAMLGAGQDELIGSSLERWLDKLSCGRLQLMGQQPEESATLHFEAELQGVRLQQIPCICAAGKMRLPDGASSRIFVFATDISEQKRLQSAVAHRERLLGILRSSTSRYVETGNLRMAADSMLEGVLEVTGSQYGFMGEVIYEDDGTPFLFTHSVTNIAWNDDIRKFYEKQNPVGFEFRNLKSLFGEVMTTGRPVIANAPLQDPRSGGLPEGHPPLNAFMGVPVYHGDRLVGMYGLANREHGYSESMLPFLEPFNTSYAVIIEAARLAHEQVHTLTALEEAKSVAEAANKSKSDFLSSMSHELRTPLNAILGFSQLCETSPDITPELQDYLGEIRQAGDHLLELVNDVLDFAKVESGSLSIEMAEVSLLEVLEPCEVLVRPLARKHRVGVFFEDSRNAGLTLQADPVRLKQALVSLINNGIKYNREGGSVEVGWRWWRKGRVRITVTDTGTGMTDEQQSSLFRPFERLGAERSTIEGTGVGLSICRYLVEHMGGELGFSSTAGEGSQFWIDLEAVAEGGAPHSDAGRAQSREQPESESHTTHAVRSNTVLCIDPDRMSRTLVAKLLKVQDIACEVAGSMEEGVAALEANNARLVILGDAQQNATLAGLATDLEKIKRVTDAPVIALTAMDAREVSGMIGIAGTVPRPIKGKALQEAVQRGLELFGNT